MRLIVQQCSKKQSSSSNILAYFKERYTNRILNGIEWQLCFTVLYDPTNNTNKQMTRKQ